MVTEVGTRRLAQIGMALVLAASAAILIHEPAAAHCPGTLASGGHDYAAGNKIGTSADGVRGTIAWINPPVCGLSTGNAFTLEGVNLCNTSACGGWVQAGWVKRQTVDSTPKFYCEYKAVGGTVQQTHFAMSNATHTYQWARSGSLWQCALDGVVRLSTTGVNFTSGVYQTAQGETNSTHSQIGGYPPPVGILFSSLQFRVTGAWIALNITIVPPDTPFWVTEPAVGQMKNGTNSH